MKIYTKRGDTGKTSLLSGERVDKYNERIEAYGTIDELNSFVGLLRSGELDNNDKLFLIRIQNKLFNLGANLAVAKTNTNIKLPDLTNEDVELLEREMDKIDATLPQLKNFVLPGGNQTVAYSHVCRSVCRRAERLIVKLSANTAVDEQIIKYINRLSDYFFQLSRKIISDLNIEEDVWNHEA